MVLRGRRSAFLGSFVALFALGARSEAQQFVRNTADVPPSASYTENVDFGDVDLDGDWDAVFANGGDVGNEQNRIWINAFGGAPIGTFTDRTDAQFPAILDSSRDVEFADIDADGDLDLHVSNHSAIVQQPSRWWVNMGGTQAGALGFYQDQTAARWSGLGGPGSSIHPSQVLAEGFFDYCCDSDFGDLDNDGDLDLVHSSYGPAHSGNVPTRIFQNDGSGVFSEFNPSLFQLPGLNIADGNPGLWCEGVQAANTLNATGAQCDIATSAIDIELGDIDGDFDLDLLQGARQGTPRMFRNQLSESSFSPFRDVTGATFLPGYVLGDGHYEQEMGDHDGDGDLDICGVNWRQANFNFTDAVYAGSGTGGFAAPVNLSSSGADDEEADYFDYDLDGDLDLVFANFSGQDRVYRNDGLGGFSFMPTGTILPSDATTSRDADACDVDFDQDYDLFVANDLSAPDWYLQNTTLANDTTAPSIPQVEQAPDRIASPAPTVVRARVLDNAPYYITWYDPTGVVVRVDGGAPQTLPARSSQGDVFRAQIPGQLVGRVCYRFVSADGYGNSGISVERCFLAAPPATGIPVCAGDGTGTPCPCGNSGALGRGCASSISPAGASLSSTGVASVASDTFALHASGVPDRSVLFFQGTGAAQAGLGQAFGDGLRCATGTVVRLGTVTGSAGAATLPGPGGLAISVRGALPAAGGVRVYQAWYRNAAPFCTPDTFNFTNALLAGWLP